MDAPNEARAGANGSAVVRVAGYLWSWVPGFVRTYLQSLFSPSFTLFSCSFLTNLCKLSCFLC